MKIIKVMTANNTANAFYKVLPELAYHRVPSKTFMQEGVMEIKPYSNATLEAMRQALIRINVKFTEIEE